MEREPLINSTSSMTNAVNKMEVGPPLALYRRSQQITLWCWVLWCWVSDYLVLSEREKAWWYKSDMNRKDERKWTSYEVPWKRTLCQNCD